MGEETESGKQSMRLAFMEIADNMEPVHEFVMGEVAYFERQGFSPQQAREIVATEIRFLRGN
jgi:hypothetical protein